jgi:tetratricopeptide (TPR) repeat protein
MGRHPISAGVRANGGEARNELLGRLGLAADASDQDIETAYNGLVEFLELAPNETRSWAAAQVREADEIFALLSGPEEDLTAASTRVSLTKDVPSQSPASPVASFAAGLKQRQTPLLWVGIPLLIVAVFFGVKGMGKEAVPGISGKPTNQTTSTAGPAAPAKVDQAKVGGLMVKITANPKDKASLQALGDLYFAAADYKTAIGWEQKVLAVDPKNQVALLALGAAQFNQGNPTEAKKHWLNAAALYPNVAETHYDLGFLYLSQTPPDMAKATAEWNKVIAIDPNSSVAKTVATHLKSLKGQGGAAHGATATPSAK